jgi:signal transduction histidine kinase
MPPRTVYLVDDDPLAAAALAAALRAETDWSVATFPDAAAALAAIDAREPAVVLADSRMRDTDGLSLLRRLERDRPAVVGIALASLGDDPGMRELVAALGALRVVGKPCEVGELRLKIEAGVERSALCAELRQVSAELERARASLESTAREAKTATERLVEAEQLAAVGRVVSGIANELTNQLALVGYAEAIKARVGADAELSEFADVIVTAQRRLAQMVDEIRDFAATDELESRLLAREPSDVGGVVDEALSIMRYDRDVRERRIVRDFRARPLAALDRKKFSQVVINLVSNAALATAPGESITVRLDADTDAGAAVVSVLDAGCGMSPAVLARLGEPFFSARRQRGSGLGVGICKRIVEDHGGTLVFSSSVGKGTRAVVRVPLLEDFV